VLSKGASAPLFFGRSNGSTEDVLDKAVLTVHTYGYNGIITYNTELKMATKSKSERFEMRVDEDILASVDKWRSEQDDLPSRAEAMRRLVELGLGKTTSEAVRFSDGEKLLVCMMGDLYRHLKLVDGEINPEFVNAAIFGGHNWALKWEMNGLFHNHEDNSQDVSFVVDVLDMWDFIESGYEKLSKKDKDRLAKEAEPFGKHVEFVGFDGNNESTYMSIARFMIEKMDRFSRFKKRELNSHMPTLSTYQRMLNVFEPMRAKLVGTGLDVDQLIAIFKVRMYVE
jgi:uncharacterized protein